MAEGDMSAEKAGSARPGAMLGIGGALKRAMDIAGACIALTLTMPLMALVALLIRLDSPGPVLFRQERVGLDGRVFRIVKFRSMVTGAESMLDELVDIGSLGEPVFKFRQDPRTTRAGRFLRRWSLDELPQFWNVLRGDMSLVGPRPEEVRVVRHYNDWQRLRLRAKPGMTGPAQVSGRADLSLADRVRLEIDYIDSYSPARDLWILLKTVPSVLRGDGAY